MEMADGLGPPSALPGVKLAANDRPNASCRQRPPLLPFSSSSPASSSSLPITISPKGGGTANRRAVARPASFGRLDPTECHSSADVGQRLRPKLAKATGIPPGLNQCVSQTGSRCRGKLPDDHLSPLLSHLEQSSFHAQRRQGARHGHGRSSRTLPLSLSSSLGGGTIGWTSPRYQQGPPPATRTKAGAGSASAFMKGHPAALCPSLPGCLEQPGRGGWASSPIGADPSGTVEHFV